jgi:hypothetical protein
VVAGVDDGGDVHACGGPRRAVVRTESLDPMSSISLF